MWEFLNVLFHVCHLLIILCNCVLWMFTRTLKISQITQLLTLISWFGFGIFYGFGYCFLTDWHWMVKEKLGETDLPLSYVKYVLDHVTGMSWNPETVDQATLIVLLISVTGCLLQTFRSLINRDHHFSS